MKILTIIFAMLVEITNAWSKSIMVMKHDETGPSRRNLLKSGVAFAVGATVPVANNAYSDGDISTVKMPSSDAVVSAAAASFATYVLSAGIGPTNIPEKEPNTPKEHDIATTESDTLGPYKNPELKYELNLRGSVDKIYEPENGGPKPFEFNREVVDIFDDMVSRSVPLYSEVIDLSLYWFERYYQPGTCVYDLGSSTGTTIDVLARFASVALLKDQPDQTCKFVGVDNSEAMVTACREKLAWTRGTTINVDVRCGDILNTDINNASVVIMNYTLQFVPVVRRQELLQKISSGLNLGGILILSEKVRAECAELQETCTWIYEDFKERRKYTRREIARKKEALMNVLIPFTEDELRDALSSAGFESVEIVAKWNNFSTFVARKKTPVRTDTSWGRKRRSQKKPVEKVSTPNLDALFDSCPVYLNDYLEPKVLSSFCVQRMQIFADKGFDSKSISNVGLQKFDSIAKMILDIPKMTSRKLVVDQRELTIGDPDELNEEQTAKFQECAQALKPWKKGPLNLFGTKIDTEWRSDYKWERLQPSLPDLKDAVVCDLGCGNGYFMYRMLEYSPKLVIGIDPNLHAWLEFNLFQRVSGVENVKFEYLKGDIMASLSGMFDVVFCLGVLYHTSDPVTMLRDIHKSMKSSSVLFVDCQGIPGDEAIALFPEKRYTNMRGVYYLPTLKTLKSWLTRSNFRNIEVVFDEELSTDEQRGTEWAQVKSLNEYLDPNDSTKTVEGYPRPRRFYVKCNK